MSWWSIGVIVAALIVDNVLLLWFWLNRKAES